MYVLLIVICPLSFKISNINSTKVANKFEIKYLQHDSDYDKEKFEDTKGAIRIHISKNRQHNGQKKKYKRTNNDQQNIHIKLKIE